MATENYFSKLNSINCNDKTEKKNGLTYLAWAYAWGEVKKLFPDSTYTIYENANGWFYHTDGNTCWVKTGVTINGIEHIEYLPVMDYKNKSIPVDEVTSFDVNKAIQRSLTKAVARHGLGLYIYAGEDLPEDGDQPQEQTQSQPSQAVRARRSARAKSPRPAAYEPMPDEMYWKVVAAYAQGKPTKTGGDYKQTWIETTHAGAEQIAKFDNDVDNWVSAHMVDDRRRVPAEEKFQEI